MEHGQPTCFRCNMKKSFWCNKEGPLSPFWAYNLKSVLLRSFSAQQFCFPFHSREKKKKKKKNSSDQRG